MSGHLNLTEAEIAQILKMRKESALKDSALKESTDDSSIRSIAIKNSNGNVFSKEDIYEIIEYIYSKGYSIESTGKLPKNNVLFVNFVDNSKPAQNFLKMKEFDIGDNKYLVSASNSKPIPGDILEAISKSATPIVYIGFGHVPMTEANIIKVFHKFNIVCYNITIKEKFGNYFAFVQTNSIKTAMTINNIANLEDEFCVHKSHFKIGYGKEPIRKEPIRKDTDYKPKKTTTGAKPLAAGAKPMAAGAKPAAAGAKPMAAGAKPMAACAKPAAAGAKPAAAGAKPIVIDKSHNTIYLGCSTTPVTPEKIMSALSKYDIPICNISIRKVSTKSGDILNEAFVITDSHIQIQKAIVNLRQIAIDLSVNPVKFRIGSKKS